MSAFCRMCIVTVRIHQLVKAVASQMQQHRNGQPFSEQDGQSLCHGHASSNYKYV